jgi:glutaminase
MHVYDNYTSPPTSLAEKRHRRRGAGKTEQVSHRPLRDNIRNMARLVQRYLDRIREEHAGVTEGALADYIPELAGVDPNGFGMSLSSADGFVYESGDATTQFTIQSISKPFTYALALDQIGADAVDARIGVEPSGEAFNEISVDQSTKIPKNPMINAGAIAAVSLIPASSPDERFGLI